MPGSTGPDLNTYTIPEVQLGDTFNVWRDASNTAIYKLNKLKIYDADTSLSAASIGATYTTAGIWTAFVQPTVTSGHTFTNLIQFTSGISASGGFTLGGNAWIVGGVSLSGNLTVGGGVTLNGNVVLGDAAADTITVNGVFGNGLTASGAIRANAGLTASTLDVSGGARISGGLSASALYASAGSTFGSTLYVGGGATFAGTTDYVGAARFSGVVLATNGVTASTLDVTTSTRLLNTVINGTVIMGSTLYQSGGAAQLLSGLTVATMLDVTGAARITGGLSASALYASTGSTFAAAVSVVGGLSASALYASAGSTFGSTVYVTSGVTAASTLDVSGAARFSGGLSASALYASAGSTFASGIYVGGGATFGGAVILLAASSLGTPSALVGTNITGTALGFTVGSAGIAQTVSTAAQPTITSLGTLTGVTVSGNTTVGYAAGATFGVSGSVFLQARAPLKFGDSSSTKWVGFQAPATVTTSTVWTLPTADGTNGQVLSTNSNGTLSWKAADGVTGTDKQIQFNLGGTLGATSGLVLEYNTAGYSAGTLGVSGGAYIMGNVGIGITTPAIGRRILDSTQTTAKLEVRGDISIPSGGFFVSKNMTLPAGNATVTIAADENAFVCGTVTVPSGTILTITSGGSFTVL